MSEAASIRLAELARRLGGELEGCGDAVVRGVAALEAAGPEELSWVGSEKYVSLVERTRAAAVLAPRGWKLPGQRPVIRVDDPDLALCAVLSWLAPPVPAVAPGVDRRAVVEPGARVEGASIGPHVFVGAQAVVGRGTQLHAGVYVGEKTTIGEDCVLYPGVVVRERVTIGSRVVIHANTVVGADGFGYLQRGGRHVKIPQIGTVVIEDDVEIGANCAIDRARSGATRIGRGSKIDNLVQIGHNCQVGEGCIIIAQCGLSGSVTLAPFAVLAGQVGIADHVRIGQQAVVGAKSGVMSDVGDGEAVMGIPAAARREFFRMHAALRRLPELMNQVRVLAARVARLESTDDDSTGS